MKVTELHENKCTGMTQSIIGGNVVVDTPAAHAVEASVTVVPLVVEVVALVLAFVAVVPVMDATDVPVFDVAAVA